MTKGQKFLLCYFVGYVCLLTLVVGLKAYVFEEDFLDFGYSTQQEILTEAE